MRKALHLSSKQAMQLSMVVLFALEGALLQFTSSINGFGNNLYATNLGASDADIGLIQMIPNAVAMLLMLPVGILSDRARSSRTVPLFMLLMMVIGYLILGFVPALSGLRIGVFFFALIFTVGGLVLYNAQWQNFFGDVVEERERNHILMQRNRFMFIVGIVAPILCGVLMGQSEQQETKLFVLQCFFFLCAAIAFAQLIVVSRIPTPRREVGQNASFSLRDVGETVREMAGSHSFRLFLIPVLLFYMIWQMDWSMWYISQVQYLKLTETDLSIYSGVFNVGQLVAVGVMAKTVRRRGADYALPFAALGLASCPIIMIVCTLLPQSLRMIGLTGLMTILDAPQVALNLCVVQILLRVAPEKSRGLAVSLFTLTTTLTNSFMPYLGVQLYTLLGANYRALIMFYCIVFVLRISSWLLLVWRYRLLRRRGELEQLDDMA